MNVSPTKRFALLGGLINQPRKGFLPFRHPTFIITTIESRNSWISTANLRFANSFLKENCRFLFQWMYPQQSEPLCWVADKSATKRLFAFSTYCIHYNGTNEKPPSEREVARRSRDGRSMRDFWVVLTSLYRTLPQSPSVTAPSRREP